MGDAAVHLLLVEDNLADARLLQENLAEPGESSFRVTHAGRLSEAVDFLRTDRFDAVLLDLTLPDSNSLDTVRRVHVEAPRTAIVVLTGLDNEALGVEAVRQGAQDYLVKGQTERRLLMRSVRYAIERQRTEEELAKYRDSLEELVAHRTAALATSNAVLQEQMLERARVEEALDITRRKLNTNLEQQRRHLASELHDSVGQQLIGLKLALEHVMACGKPALGPDCAKTLGGAIEECMTLIREVRTISHGLYPPALEAFGLASALRQLAVEVGRTCPATVTCPEEMEAARYSQDAEIALFRIAQEAVHNAIVHGRAKKIDIQLNHEAGDILMTVTDDGVGFAPSKATGKGLGLISMRDRASTAGGDLTITSRPSETRLVVRIPAEPRPPANQATA
jgi:signal transduction histidine kinase